MQWSNETKVKLFSHISNKYVRSTFFFAWNGALSQDRGKYAVCKITTQSTDPCQERNDLLEEEDQLLEWVEI